MSNTDLTCCHIADVAQDPLRSPALTRGDERALIDRHACRRPASWEIWGASRSPYDVTHACDAHLAELQCPGDIAHRIGP